MSSAQILGLAAPTTALPGVGPARARQLERLGVRSVRDLLFLMPRRLERWPAPVAIAAALAEPAGRRLRVAGEVASWSFSRFGRRSLVRVKLADPTGTLEVLFFNQAWLRERFRRGEQLELVGRRVDTKGKPALVCERLGGRAALPAPGSLEATYPAGEGLSQGFLRALVRDAAERHAVELAEPLAARMLAELDLPELPLAVRELHAPSDEAGFTRAGRRVALESILLLQAQLAARRELERHAHAVKLAAGERERLLAHLPFTLTRGQTTVVDELAHDLARGVPMRRLLQGDVGSGKTALGLFACLAVAAAGGQSAFMAPTELLAEQHFAGARALLERAGVRAVLLTGSLPAAERRKVLAQLADGGGGPAQVAFGTHALFSADVRFARLWLAVIDEQHRFGVEQRRALVGKGEETHLLLMTATPIPRSLALTVYGDLDVSLLRDKPPGRAPIATAWRGAAPGENDSAELARRLADGERAYWVVPRIETPDADEDEDPEASEAPDSMGAEERHERLRATPLAQHGLELVHGRLPAAERARRIERFRAGAVRLLVATTVIEVGVDVPEASVMLVEGAERMGLAQLHQLRGRVGRGARPSRCWLFGQEVARERLELLERCDDGFEIAEADLVQRGMGDLLGVRQAGLDGTFDPTRDLALLEAARKLLTDDPELARAYAPRGA